jgi:uncharacterized membrane protein YfcA
MTSVPIFPPSFLFSAFFKIFGLGRLVVASVPFWYNGGMKVLTILLVGGVAGVLSGVFGIGGGIVLVPMLIFLLGYNQLTASGTSLVALLGPVGILGVYEYYRTGKIGNEHIKLGLLIACGMAVGAYVGAKIAVNLPELFLKRAFSIFLIIVALKMWFGK